MKKTIVILLFLLCYKSVFATENYNEAVAMLNAMQARASYKVAMEQFKEKLGISSEGFVEKYGNRIFHEMARIYSEVYSQKELSEIRKFYESKAGKAFLNKKPLLTEKYMEVLQKLILELNESGPNESFQ